MLLRRRDRTGDEVRRNQTAGGIVDRDILAVALGATAAGQEAQIYGCLAVAAALHDDPELTAAECFTEFPKAWRIASASDQNDLINGVTPGERFQRPRD
jgi:hypothetical protein